MSRAKVATLTGLAVIAITASTTWMNGSSRIEQAGAPLLAGVAAAGLPAAVAQPMPGNGRTIGFAATYFYYDVYDKNPSMCPNGLNQSYMELYLATLDEAERKRLSHPDNAKEMVFGKSSFDLAGKPMCLDPDAPVAPAMKPEFKVVSGNGPANGLDLDGQISRSGGKAAANTCGHEDFAGVNGNRGVDNQFYRVIGCTAGFRNDALAAQMAFGSEVRNGSWNFLIELGEVDDRQNDPDITVTYYSANTPGPFAGAVTPVPWRSVSVIDDKRYIAVSKGRIENGIVKSSPVDLNFIMGRPRQGSDRRNGRSVYLRGARLDAKFDKDGLAGTLGGYLDLESFVENSIRHSGLAWAATGAASVGGYSCPSLKAALDRYADGYRDPQTGKCTAISTSYTLKAIPVFLIKSEQHAASAN